MHFESVAWVPDDDSQRDWEIAARLAADWIDARCVEERAAGVLVTNTLDHHNVPALDDFERRHMRTSPRASRDRVGRGAGPVLSYVPHARELEFAMGLARGSSLAVVETAGFPLTGWAAWLGAWDLIRDQPTPPLPDPLRQLVRRLAFHGNKGFGDEFGKVQARSMLRETRIADGDQDVILGAVLAVGVSARGVDNLAKLMRHRRN